MPRIVKAKQVGLAPGVLVHIGEKKVEEVRIAVTDYDESQYEEKEVESIEECFPYKEKTTSTWVNVNGLHDIDVIERLGECFGIHPLVLEDIVHTGQRAKMEDFDTYIFIVLRMPGFNDETNELEDEQISLVLGENFVLTFQEKKGDVLDTVRDRLRKGKGRIRKAGAGYLAYALVDAIVDSYFVVLEWIAERVESLEEELVSDPSPHTLRALHHLKREMILLRKSVWPMREAVNSLARVESRFIGQTTQMYLRDVYDHAVQVIDTVETLREMVSGMLDTYLSSVSNRMNEVMKVLTMIATIFIPITFIAGIYGMNFEHMPELHWRWGYLFVWGLMLGIGVSMIVYFRRRKWQ